MILGARDDKRRSLEVRLPGTGTRQASIGYVIAAPVWKVSYRLDLSPDKPQFQGWAIVDNPSDLDWKGVSLSLVSGRPVSFIQDLYPPLYLDRPTLPLAIAGIAAARSFDRASPAREARRHGRSAAPRGRRSRRRRRKWRRRLPRPRWPPEEPTALAAAAASPLGSSAALETAKVGKAGDQFQFTVKKPVSLDRGRSAMLPLVAGDIAAERVSVFSPDSDSSHPMLGARLSNSTGIRLPAGPIVVFDGGVYAGDALLDFFPGEGLAPHRLRGRPQRNDRRIDLEFQETVAVKISKGVMSFSRRITLSRSYTFKNGSADAKKIDHRAPDHPGGRPLRTQGER